MSLSIRSGFACLSFAFATALASEAPAVEAQPAQPALGSDVAYDQIMRSLVDATPPPPGSFATDAARIAALPPMPDAKGAMAPMTAMLKLSAALSLLPGAIIAESIAGIAARNAARGYGSQVMAALGAAQVAGQLMHVSNYHGWVRTDFPSRGASIILKPETGSLVSLNLAAKTYRTSTFAPLVPEEQQGKSAWDGVTIEFGADPVTTSLGPMVLAGLPARGYQTVARFTTSAGVGYCRSGDHEVTEVEYVIDVPDPHLPPGPPLAGSAFAREVCLPSSDGAHQEPGRLVVFRSTSITGGLQGTVVSVNERDNVRALGPADEPAFSIPPDFTEEPLREKPGQLHGGA